MSVKFVKRLLSFLTYIIVNHEVSIANANKQIGKFQKFPHTFILDFSFFISRIILGKNNFFDFEILKVDFLRVGYFNQFLLKRKTRH